MSALPWLSPDDYSFPDPEEALADPNGLLALGGDLAPERICNAYRQGIFPWYEEDQPILWWSPNPRMVLFPAELHISKSLAKAIKRSPLKITYNQAFSQVIQACAGHRSYASGTWITDEMMQSYSQLHELGVAHSVEAWYNNTLVGGLYGLALGEVFYGESMFSRETNASKIAFVTLVKKLKMLGFKLIDCQVASTYLASFGAKEISRIEFRQHLANSSVDNLAQKGLE